MKDSPLPAPTNWLVTVVNTILDVLIKGLGAPAAIAAATIKFPFLGLPIIRTIFKGIVNAVASGMDETIKKNLDNILIRFQNNEIKDEYDKAKDELNRVITTPGVSDAEKAKALQDAKDAIDRLVRRAKLVRPS